MDIVDIADAARCSDFDNRAERDGVIKPGSATMEAFGTVLVFAEYRGVCLEPEFDFLESGHLLDGYERVGVVVAADLLFENRAGHCDRQAAAHEPDEDQGEDSNEQQGGDRTHEHNSSEKELRKVRMTSLLSKRVLRR